jgi:Family of unknown function (DUF695)/Regulator of ribonuclease activity B
MKYFVVLQTIICSFLSVSGQTEHWDTYVSKFGGRPGSVMVDMGLIETAPDTRYPFLLITGPRALKCDKNGIPGKEEINQMEDILGATSAFLEGATAKVLAGTFTYNCERLNYYYVKDTSAVRSAVRRLYNRTYPGYQFAINIKVDPEWKIYRTFLYPDDATMNWMDNERKIAELAKTGDSMSKPRDISFNFYFNSDTARGAFEEFAVAAGYKVKQRTVSTKKPVLYAIIVSRNSAVKLEELNKMTGELKAEADKHHGYFSGWEAGTK